MSLQSQTSYPIPEDTQRVARAAFPKGNLYMRMRDELGEIYQDASELCGVVSGARSEGRVAGTLSVGHGDAILRGSV